jgi:hypothetical protein
MAEPCFFRDQGGVNPFNCFPTGPAALPGTAPSPKTSFMRLALHRQLRRTASMMMLLAAAVAFLAQGTMIAVSQAAAANGSMPQPAVIVSGALHYHDPLARHFHIHHDKDAAGHVHEPDDHDDDGIARTSFVTLGTAAADIPAAATCTPACVVSDAQPCPIQARLKGVQPDGLNRPPSTPDIA